MAAFKERRTSPKKGKAVIAPAPKRAAAPQVLVDDAGFHTMDAIREFVQYDLDGGAQTEWHEQFVNPLCMAIIGIDGLAALPEDARSRLQASAGEALSKLTRRADRLARSGDEYIVLLRRTLSKKAHDFYVPNARKAIAEACGNGTTICAGISSLTEHMVKGSDDMIKKALSALAVARKQGPGSTVVYDFRTMPY